MGRVMKWLKGLFSMNKNETANSSFRGRENEGDSSFGHSLRRVNSTGLICNPPTTPQNMTPLEAAWLSNMSTLYDGDQEIHTQAMVVISATMAVVEATVEAEEAADKLRRLTNRGREISAVITIQTIFRGFLARKALKALKALVKIQARVRGLMVRKRIHATFHKIMALQRAEQRAIRARLAQNQSKKSLEKFDNSGRVFKGACPRSKSISVSFRPNVTVQCVKHLEVNKKCINGFNGDETYSDGRNRAQISFARRRSFDESYKRGYVKRGDENNNTTALSGPMFTKSSGSNLPINQQKCEPDNVCFSNGNENCPNYMVDTGCFNAKGRSQSFSKQRSDEVSGSRGRRASSISEITMESKSSCSRGQVSNYLQDVVMANIVKNVRT